MLSCAMLATLLIISCGGDDSPAGRGGGPMKEAPLSMVWLSLLHTLPDTADARGYIVMNNYAAMRSQLNLQPPTDSPADIAEYRKKLLIAPASSAGPNGAMPSHLSGLGQYFDPEEWQAQLGFNPGQVDFDIVAGKPPQTYEMVRGRFDAKGIDSAIDKDTSPVRAQLTRTTREGATVYAWGEDQRQDLSNRSSVRPLGRGGRLAVRDKDLYWTHWTEGVNAMVDAATGKKPSLADDANVRALMAGFEKHGAYTVVITNQGITPDLMDVVGPNASVVREAREASFKEALKPYGMLAIGLGQDAQGPYSVLVLLHADDATAKENVTRLKAKIDAGRSAQTQKPWKEYIQSSEINAEGRLLIARLRTTPRILLLDVLNKRDSLLAHE
jgi:hypothetical protein